MADHENCCPKCEYYKESRNRHRIRASWYLSSKLAALNDIMGVWGGDAPRNFRRLHRLDLIDEIMKIAARAVTENGPRKES